MQERVPWYGALNPTFNAFFLFSPYFCVVFFTGQGE